MVKIEIKKSTDLMAYSGGLAFFLPVETRPKEMHELTDSRFNKYWHVGIIYQGKVYETFNSGKYDISEVLKRGQELLKQKAVFVSISEIDRKKLEMEIISGTSCDEYVLRCIGISDRKGNDKGDRFPDDVYDLLIGKNIVSRSVGN